MFEFDPRAKYLMPAHFGVPEMPKPPSGWYRDVTTMNVQYLTDRERLQALLPHPFKVAEEALVTVTYAQSRDIDWLAGRGYNLISVNAAVVFEGDQEQLEGSFTLVVWENLADPILSGRELTGIPKIFADIDDHTVTDEEWRCGASHFGSAIVDLSIRNLTVPTAEQVAAAQAEQESKDNPMAWRYIPAVGGFGAAISEPTIYPSKNVITDAQIGEGRIEWHRLTWEQNPTQFHIVNKLADLPVLEYRPAIVTKGSTNLFLPERWPRSLAPRAARTIEEIQKICYVGAGTMGCANSLVAAISGYDVVIYDLSKESLAQVTDKHREMGAYLVATGYCSAKELEASAARVSLEQDLQNAVAGADLISESIVEDLEIKREVHSELDKLSPANAILTTNTSGFLVSDIEDIVQRGDCFAALHSHYGSPLIDIVRGPRTSDSTIDVLERYVLSLKCVPLILHKENRGYVYNGLMGAVLTVALILLVEGIASKEQIDAAWMKHRRADRGPFGLMDLFGLNVVYDGWKHRESDPGEDILQPKIAAFLESYVNRGEFGLKSGKGFYSYPNPEYEQSDFVDSAGETTIPNLAMTTALISHAILLASRNIASTGEIDRAWMVGLNLDTGPFVILEEIGVDAFRQLLHSDANMLSPSDTKNIEEYLEQKEAEEAALA
ncbi:MAG: acetoacetate decarboxylase family protein [Gammaproteobacteria bacterium]|nr:acetoacetate decarboxylase family protein [Gammaproteobacteria bacterium]